MYGGVGRHRGVRGEYFRSISGVFNEKEQV